MRLACHLEKMSKMTLRQLYSPGNFSLRLLCWEFYQAGSGQMKRLSVVTCLYFLSLQQKDLQFQSKKLSVHFTCAIG